MPTRRTSPRRALTRPTTRPTVVGDAAADPPAENQFLAFGPWIALLALAVAIVAVGLVFLNRGQDLSACRSQAWSAIPDQADLPADWALGSTDQNANGMTISIVGPASSDDTTQPPTVYASITCYGDVAATAMSQGRDAAEAAGAEVTDRTGGGDAYDIDNSATGSTTTLFRVGSLIGQVADAGTASPNDLATITRAVATAMGDETAAGTSDVAAASDEPAGSDDLSADGSAEPSASAAAPELEAKLPKEIGGTPLTVQSTTADQVFGDDPNSRALSARIRALGGQVADVQVAQAYDDAGAVDVSIIAFRLPGKDGTKLRDAVVETWLSADAAGVTKTDVTLAGKPFEKIDYGDQGTVEYVYTGTDYVIVVDTSDPAIATEVAGKVS
ncbi:MAG TPA: hypothetical protein VH440_08000 [Candidatus Limnocylindrales bacterium]|jgi:hypothetical protein